MASFLSFRRRPVVRSPTPENGSCFISPDDNDNDNDWYQAEWSTISSFLSPNEIIAGTTSTELPTTLLMTDRADKPMAGEFVPMAFLGSASVSALTVEQGDHFTTNKTELAYKFFDSQGTRLVTYSPPALLFTALCVVPSAVMHMVTLYISYPTSVWLPLLLLLPLLSYLAYAVWRNMKLTKLLGISEAFLSNGRLVAILLIYGSLQFVLIGYYLQYGMGAVRWVNLSPDAFHPMSGSFLVTYTTTLSVLLLSGANLTKNVRATLNFSINLKDSQKSLSRQTSNPLTYVTQWSRHLTETLSSFRGVRSSATRSFAPKVLLVVHWLSLVTILVLRILLGWDSEAKKLTLSSWSKFDSVSLFFGSYTIAVIVFMAFQLSYSIIYLPCLFLDECRFNLSVLSDLLRRLSKNESEGDEDAQLEYEFPYTARLSRWWYLRQRVMGLKLKPIYQRMETLLTGWFLGAVTGVILLPLLYYTSYNGSSAFSRLVLTGITFTYVLFVFATFLILFIYATRIESSLKTELDYVRSLELDVAIRASSILRTLSENDELISENKRAILMLSKILGKLGDLSDVPMVAGLIPIRARLLFSVAVTVVASIASILPAFL